MKYQIYVWAIMSGGFFGLLTYNFIKELIKDIKSRLKTEKVKSLFLQEFDEFLERTNKCERKEK